MSVEQQKNEIFQKLQKKRQPQHRYIFDLTSIFVRNRSKIVQCLEILMGCFLLLTVEHSECFINRNDRRRKLRFWRCDNACYHFTDLNRISSENPTFSKGCYEYRLKVQNPLTLLCKLMLPMAVELAAFPDDWVVECESRQISSSFKEFGKKYCAIFTL
jgi:hypothetical protein